VVCSRQIIVDEMNTRACIWSVAGFAVILITSCVLFGLSFDTIEPYEIGIVYDGNVQHLETSETWSNGRYLVGLGKQFITFPTTTQTLRFGDFYNDEDGPDISVRSHDGMVVTLEISFQYQLSQQVDDLARLYLDYEDNWEPVYGFEFESAVMDVASNFNMFQFFTDRSGITADIIEAMNARLEVLYATCYSVEIANMQVDRQLVDAIESTQVAVQYVQQVLAELQIAQIQADTSVQQASLQAQIQLAAANATANGVTAQAHSQAATVQISVAAQIEAFQNLRAALNLTTSEQLLSYMWTSAIQSSEAENLVVGIKYPSPIASFFAQSTST